jgi:predicted DCC family thiol-disulfide oxidoreductase YuxK
MALVLFFDGDCAFCSKSVRYVYQLDAKGVVEFAPLQGVLAAEFDLRKHAEKGGGSMVILRESDAVMFTKSDAIIELGKALGGVWAALARAFSLFPRLARDRVYDLIAKNRHMLAGKGNQCALADKDFTARMRN